MAHAGARLTVHGKRLLVQWVRDEGLPVAHVAAAMGISRQCAHRWVRRWDAEGDAGLWDRSTGHTDPPTAPRPRPRNASWLLAGSTAVVRTESVHTWVVPARTVNRVLHRHLLPPLRLLDPLTGAVARASKTTTTRYERSHPGELVHADVKKLGRIPEGGGWRVHGRAASDAAKGKCARIGYDYVHSMIDGHTRLAYSEVLPDETGATCTANRSSCRVRPVMAGATRRTSSSGEDGYDSQSHLTSTVEKTAARAVS